MGRSTKNVASNLPARRNSGGRFWMEFAVAITIVEDLDSARQVRKCPNMPAVVPASVSPLDLAPENPLSTSSIQTTASPNASITAVACLILRSDSPTSDPLRLPISSLINGQPMIDAAALHDNDFPVPGIPTSSTPLGRGRFSLPVSKAFALIGNERFELTQSSHVLNACRFPELHKARSANHLRFRFRNHTGAAISFFDQ